MADSKIAKTRIPEFLTAVTADYAVYGPKDCDGVVVFGRIASAEELKLDYRNSSLSPKELFLPKTETVYEFDGQNYVDDALPQEKRVIIGMRPCDSRALTLLDRIFDTEQIKDPFYTARRANTVVLTQACNMPLSSCFCTAVGGDPYGEEGADVLLSDVGDSMFAKSITEKGKDFLKHYSKFFTSGSGDWAKQAKKAKDKIESSIQTADVKSCLDGLFENEIWESASRKCLGCGMCSYLCPTCYCFDLTDEKTATGARKVRRWDCCMFPSFTRHASGHNPRPVNAPRLRQKVMHKFSYFMERYDLCGCVGCGRCVRSCPVNLDIRLLIEELKAASQVAVEK